jgi:peptidoglycan/LPS O-acetylase OafA/YrhL
VVLHHTLIAFDFAFYNGVPTPGHNAWNAKLAGWPFLLPLAGNYAVCVFFALSGFVLASSFSRTKLGTIALVTKRSLRLAIPILAVTLFAWAIVACGLAFNIEASQITQSWWMGKQVPPSTDFMMALRDGLYGALLGLPDAAGYDSSLWTMSIEFMGSLLMIAVFAAMRPFRGRPASDGWLIVIFVMLGLLGHFLYLALFAFGAALKLARLREPLERLPGSIRIMAAMLVLGVFLGTIPYAQTRGWWFDLLAAHAPVGGDSGWQAQDGPFRGIAGADFWHAAGALLTLIAADNWPALRNLLGTRIPQFLGRISFPLYLLHVPILISAGCGLFLFFIHAGLSPAPAWALAATGFIAIACLLSWAATPMVEEPAVRWSAKAARYLDRRLERLSLPHSPPGSE